MWLTIIKTFLPSTLKFICSHINKFALVALVLFISGLFITQYHNRQQIEKQTMVIESLHEKVVARDEKIDEMKQDLTISREIIEQNELEEQNIRNSSYEQILSIKKMLETHQCGRATLPDTVADELRK